MRAVRAATAGTSAAAASVTARAAQNLTRRSYGCSVDAGVSTLDEPVVAPDSAVGSEHQELEADARQLAFPWRLSPSYRAMNSGAYSGLRGRNASDRGIRNA
jgi:hypothetical protein